MRTIQWFLSLAAGMPMLLTIAPTPAHAQNLAWIVKGPGTAIGVDPIDRIPITVVVGTSAANDLRVIASTLVEQSRRRLLGIGGFKLCNNPIGNCELVTASLAAGSSQTVYLGQVEGWPTAGHYSGSVTVASSLKPEGEAIQIELYITTGCQMAMGAVAVFVGLVLAWLITVWARSQFNRDQLILPAARIRDNLMGLQNELSTGARVVDPACYVNTIQQVGLLVNDLAESSLEKQAFVPSRLTAPFTSAQLLSDAYKKQLQGADDWLAVLKSIIEDGMVPVWQQLPRTPDPTAKTAVDAAIKKIDQLVSPRGPAPALASVIAQIATIRNGTETTLKAITAHVPNSSAPALVGPTSARTYAQIQLHLYKISGIAWGAVAVVTMLVGTYVVVLSNLGFGLWTDYFQAVFWGLGLPTGTTLLQQTLPTTSAALGISLTK